MARNESRDQKRKRKKAQKAKRSSTQPPTESVKRYWIPHYAPTGDLLHLVDDDGLMVCYAYTTEEQAKALGKAVKLPLKFEVIDGATFLGALMGPLPIAGVDILVLDDELYLPVTLKGAAGAAKTDPRWAGIPNEDQLRLWLTRHLTMYMSDGIHVPLGLPDDPIEVQTVFLGSELKDEFKVQGKTATIHEHNVGLVQKILDVGKSVLLTNLGRGPLPGENFIVKVQVPLSYSGEGVAPLRIYDRTRRVDMYSADTKLADVVYKLLDGAEKGYMYCIRGDNTNFYFDHHYLAPVQDW